NGRATRGDGADEPSTAGLTNVNEDGGGCSGTEHSSCSCKHAPPQQDRGTTTPTQDTTTSHGDGLSKPLLLNGARDGAAPALLKLQATVHSAGGSPVPVQPMVDSGASGMGFADPAFVQRCGAELRPSSRRITLADG